MVFRMELIYVLSIFIVVASTDKICQSENNEYFIRCIQLEFCQPIQNVVESIQRNNISLDASIQMMLKSYLCGFDGTTPKVWCASNETQTEQKPSKTDLVTPEIKGFKFELPDVGNHPNIKLLPYECGRITTDTRIVNGNKTNIMQFPWMALLAYATSHGPVFKCGGTIINDQYILTAAHCIVNTKDELVFVRIGEHNISYPVDCEVDELGDKFCAPPHQDVTILDIIPHANYNSTEYTNDIGLIKVVKMNFSESVQAICLPLGKTINFDFVKHPNVRITGWGVTEDYYTSLDLRQASLKVVDIESCRKIYERSISINYYSQLCASDDKSLACNGDSGGPLQSSASLNDDERMIQHGIISFGPKFCSNPDHPGVYTRVAFYMKWILSKLTD